MTGKTSNSKQIPIDVVGSSSFGRFASISPSRTYNMFISEDATGKSKWLINFAGYQSVKTFFDTNQEGRGLFHSVRGNFLLVVVEAEVFRVNPDTLSSQNIGQLDTTTGEVFIDENLNSQIALVDGQDVYIYNYNAGQFGKANLRNDDDTGAFSGNLEPNYVAYHNTYFLFGNGLSTNDGSLWYIFDPASGNLDIKLVQTLTLQTKPDYARAVIRMPGRGNNIMVFGQSVAEIWTNVGGLQVYQRNSSVNIDYGVASVSTIAANDQVIAWLGINERSAPSIMVSTGGNAHAITHDGIDELLANVSAPSDSTAIMFRQDHHLFYQLTFYNDADDFTIVYDFTTQRFYDLTDFDFTHAPARQTGFINNTTYFVSLKDGHLYRTDVNIDTYNTHPSQQHTYEIPRMRICSTIRGETPLKFIVQRFSFVIEAGTADDVYETTVCYGALATERGQRLLTNDGKILLIEGGYCSTENPRIDLRVSKNGGYTYSNAVSYQLKPVGNYAAQPRFNRLGECQAFTAQLQFWGFNRFVVKNGAIEVRS